MVCSLSANQTYYIKAGSKAGLTGNVSVYVKKIKISNTSSTLSITGKFSTTYGEKVSIAIYDNNGELTRIAQNKTASGGTFSYSTPTTGLDIADKADRANIPKQTGTGRKPI